MSNGTKAISFSLFCLGDMEKAFLTRLDELNVIIPEIYLKNDRKKDVIEDILELLAEAYILGIKDSSEMMEEEIRPDEAIFVRPCQTTILPFFISFS